MVKEADTARQPSPMTRVAVEHDLLSALVETKYLTLHQVAIIKVYMARWRLSAFHALLETKIWDETKAADVIAQTFGLDRVYQLSFRNVAPGAIETLSFQKARRWECVPLLYEDDGVCEDDGSAPNGLCELVVADPTLFEAWQELTGVGGPASVKLAIGERSEILKAIDVCFPLSAQVPSLYAASR